MTAVHMKRGQKMTNKKEGTLFFWVEEAWLDAGQTHQRTHRLRPPAPSAAGSQNLWGKKIYDQ
jgi:hypothetical protein